MDSATGLKYCRDSYFREYEEYIKRAEVSHYNSERVECRMRADEALRNAEKCHAKYQKALKRVT